MRGEAGTLYRQHSFVRSFDDSFISSFILGHGVNKRGNQITASRGIGAGQIERRIGREDTTNQSICFVRFKIKMKMSEEWMDG